MMKLTLKTENKATFISRIRTGIYGCVLVTSLLLAACGVTKHLPANEKLYTGAKLTIESVEHVSKRDIKAATQSSLRPIPNKSYLGLYPRLWLYQLAGEKPKSKFKKWLRKIGEPPVLKSSVNPSATAAIIDAKLFNIGIFNSYTEFKIVENKHTAHIIYITHVHKPYTVEKMEYAISDDSLSRTIINAQNESLIQQGKPYNLEKLKSERARIDVLLKNKGYFYFNPDYLVFKADTSTVDKTIRFKVMLKDSIPPNALRIYRINRVFINQDYSLETNEKDSAKNIQTFQNNLFLSKDGVMNIRQKVILRSIYLRKNDVYSRENHAITLNRLMSMGNFKFVQVKFSESDTTATGYLDVMVLMTPMPNHTFRAELELVTKSNSFTGPRMNVSMSNRNAFRGAELLTYTMAGAFEAQLNGKSKNQISYSLNPELSLTFPRFLVPFYIRPSNSIYVPKTSFSISFNYLKRVNYFDMRTFQFGYGFKWKENSRTEHIFNPLSVSYNSIVNQSDVFKALLYSNAFLERSYEEQFIAGGNYSFTYNEQVSDIKTMQYFLHFTAETAGNVFALAKLIGGKKSSADHPSKIIGSYFSQYAKLSVDARAYYNLDNKDKLAFRIFAGVAKAYGNSSTTPYSKQFFSGGPSSLRAFQTNSLGPGTYFQNKDSMELLQLGGDIKFETNAEYRFSIYRIFKGAVFVDAGNIWLQKSNPLGNGTGFSFSSFANELAVGTGIGLRVDVSFFVLRFDLAMPLRKPWLPENHRWVFDKINFGSSTWRSENLMLNIAIGYPF